jgi:DNA-binding transcriptional regulator YdaS (Cro superfamily)
MTLQEYLAANSIRPAHFAKTLGVNATTVHRIINGERKPSLLLASRIEDITNHEVTCRELAGVAEAA